MRILGLIGNTNMSASHERLKLIAADNGFYISQMAFTDTILFMNKKKNRLKALTGGGQVIGYLALDKGTVNQALTQTIPNAFANGFKFDTKLASAFDVVKKKEINYVGYRYNKTVAFKSKNRKEKQSWLNAS